MIFPAVRLSPNWPLFPSRKYISLYVRPSVQLLFLSYWRRTQQQQHFVIA